MSLPPGPRVPRRVFELALLFRPLAVLEACARDHGDPFRVGGRSSAAAVYFSNPVAIQQILTADPRHFEPRRGEKVLRHLLGDNAVQYLTGDRHQRTRRLLSPPFHGERLRDHGRLIHEVTEERIARWAPGQTVALRSFFQDVTLQVITAAVFGRRESPGLECLRQELGALLDSVGPPWAALALSWSPRWPSGPWGFLERRKRRLDQLVLQEIRERRAQAPGGPDVLGLLLAARDEAGQPMTEPELRDQVMSLMFAGHETTASALAWALYRVVLDARVHGELCREIDGLRSLEPAQIVELPYLGAVCQETLRLYPGVVALIRTLNAPLEVLGHRLEPGTDLIPCIYLTHRRSDLYPEPARFRPERFQERQYSPYEYLPFGAGGRRCIGMAFAQFEMKLVLATILSRWHLAPTDPQILEPVRRGVFAAPPSGMRLRVVQGR